MASRSRSGSLSPWPQGSFTTPPRPGASGTQNSRTTGTPNTATSSDVLAMSSLESTPESHEADSTELHEANSTESQSQLQGVLTTPERQRLLTQRVELARHESRRKGTKILYGDFTDPENGGSYTGEFIAWCALGPNMEFKGCTTLPTKRVMDHIATSYNCIEFLQDHFLKWPKLDKKTKTYSIKEPHSKSAIQNVIKALGAMYRYQKSIHPDGAEAFVQKYGKGPNEERQLGALKTRYCRDTAQHRRTKHLPRGKGALTMEGYSRNQNLQMFEFGVINDSRAKETSLSKMKLRLIHTHHAFAHNFALRFDDRQKLLLSQFCCTEAPTRMDKTSGQLLCAVLDWRKTNREGTFETIYCLRHLDDPIQCSWFAFCLELYCQINIDGLSLSFDDFVPVKKEDGTYHHPWYDRYFFFGNTRSCRGIASVPSVLLPCNYDNVRNAFHIMYALIVPIILCFHILHLQRGTVARMANHDQVDGNEIANAGG